MLTEHLCTIISHNEERKAKRLSELMEKVGLSLNGEYDDSSINGDSTASTVSSTVETPQKWFSMRVKQQLPQCDVLNDDKQQITKNKKAICKLVLSLHLVWKVLSLGIYLFQQYFTDHVMFNFIESSNSLRLCSLLTYCSSTVKVKLPWALWTIFAFY